MQRIKDLTYGTCYVVVTRDRWERYKHYCFCPAVYKDLATALKTASKWEVILEVSDGVIRECQKEKHC